MLMQVWLHPPLSNSHSSRSETPSNNKEFHINTLIFTITIQLICCQSESCITETFEKSIGVYTCLVTASIVSETLINVYKSQSKLNTFYSVCLVVPSQSRLFAAILNPSSQEHSNEPWVLVHVWLHPPLSTRHSSISVKKLRLF